MEFEGVEYMVHADIDDKAQTVKIVEEIEGKGYPKTRAIATAVVAGAGGLALLAYGLAGAGSALLKRRKQVQHRQINISTGTR